MNKYLLSVVFILTSFFANSQSITSDQLEKNIRYAKLIVEGEVLSHNCFWDIQRKNIYTSYQIKVFQVLKGKSSENLEVIIKGGIVDNIWQQVSTSIELKDGELGFFILKNITSGTEIVSNEENIFQLVGGEKGFLEINSQVMPDYDNAISSDKLISDFILTQNLKQTSFAKIDEPRLKSGTLAHTITSISPKILTAGTGALLDIYGTGFGSSQGNGQVWFVYADNSSNIFSNTGFEIKMWTDTHIQLVVPDNAATGNVRVKINDEFAISSEILTVKYAYMNSQFLPAILINANQEGGYTWNFNDNINSNVLAKNLIEKSIKKWVCSTMIPWKIGAVTSATSGMDNLCTIYFGKLENEGDERLGQANGFYEGIIENSKYTKWVLKEVDIVFVDDGNWCYNRANLNSTQKDFESVVLHELAHAHLIGHVNDENDLMHYGIENGNYRDINALNIECGNYVINQCLKFSNTEYKTIVLSQDNLISTPDKIVGNTIICAGKSEVYSIPATPKASSYNWTLPNGTTGTSTTNSITVNFGSSAVSGNISVKGINGCGISAPSSLGVIVNQLPIKPTIIQNVDVLHSSVSIGNQWYDKNGLISGATNQDYTPKTSGDYYVIISNNGCSSAPSNTVHLIPTTVYPISLSNAIKVYPNPVTNELIIEIIENNIKTKFEIINSVGQLVTSGQLQDRTVIQTDHFIPGIYLIKLKSGEILDFRKIVKN